MTHLTDLIACSLILPDEKPPAPAPGSRPVTPMKTIAPTYPSPLVLLGQLFEKLSTPQSLCIDSYPPSGKVKFVPTSMSPADLAQRPFILDPGNPRRNMAKGFAWSAIRKVAQRHLEHGFRDFLPDLVMENDLDDDEAADAGSQEVARSMVEMGIAMQKRVGDPNAPEAQVQALEFFKEAVVADPNYVPGLIRAGVMYMNLNKYDEAEPLLKKAPPFKVYIYVYGNA